MSYTKETTSNEQNNTPKRDNLPFGALPMLLISALFIAMLIAGEEFDLLFAFTAIFWLPLLLIGLGVLIFNIIRFCNPQKRTTHSRIVVIWGAANILLAIGVWLQDKHSSSQVDADNLIAHYEQHEAEIWDAAEYARSAMDSGAWMRLEFDGKEVAMFHTCPAGDSESYNWREYRGPSLDAASIGRRIGLTPDEIEGIRQRLDAAGCVSIELKNYGTADSVTSHGKTRPVSDVDFITIGRCRHSMSMYFYNLHPHPMSDTTWNYLLLSDETRIPVCDTMALEYGSPAFGSISYPLKDKIIRQLRIEIKQLTK